MTPSAPEPAGLEHPHVDTNPWPPIGALGLGLLAFGVALTLSFRLAGLVVLVVAAILAATGTVGWWRDLVQEARTGTLPTAHAASRAHQPGQDFRLAMILFIASEVMFFSAFFGFYFYTRAGAASWPPPGSERAVESLLLPSLMTLALITSGFTYTWGEASLMRNDRRGLITGLVLTVLLGLAFLSGQGWEWSHARLHFTDNVLGNAFYMLTGFHGLHVIIGTVFILVNLVRATRGHFSKSSHFALVGAGWYWHFVDVVWILLFLSLYVF